LYNHGRFAELAGKSIGDQSLADGKISVSFELVSRVQLVVDPQSNSVPGLIAGAIKAEKGSKEIIHLAIAVNGAIGVVTRTYPLRGATRFSGLVPEEAFRAGENQVEVYRIIEKRLGGEG
jgi:hypothetical protein